MPAIVLEIDLEAGRPAADTAVINMKNSLMACPRRGIRAALLIHGYGSSGVGGAIRLAVRGALADGSLSTVVRDFVPGEQWHWRKRELLAQCPALARYERRIANNEGITVVLLR